MGHTFKLGQSTITTTVLSCSQAQRSVDSTADDDDDDDDSTARKDHANQLRCIHDTIC